MSKASKVFTVCLWAAAIGACQKGTTTAPSRVVTIGDGSTATPKLTAPEPESPANQQQLSTLRPTLTVRNGSSNQAGTRTYDFQISDRSDFASTAPASRYFAVVTSGTGIPEGSNGTTSFTPNQDLQPTTRFYWRARVVQGTAVSDWTEPSSFNSKLIGYNRPGELYDPLIHSETIGTLVGSTTFIGGKGIRINDQNSYVRYQLQQTISGGEFSVEIEGLYAGGPGAKLKLFSMMDGTGDLYRSKYLLNVQYRGGQSGNPDNCIAFKALFGDEDFKLEPDIGRRTASVMSLNPTRTYYWKATWSTEFRLLIQDGGIGGNTIYDYGIQTPGGSYNPNPHFAYLGANNGPYGEEDGSWPGAVYRNVWIGNRPRPTSLGSALTQK